MSPPPIVDTLEQVRLTLMEREIEHVLSGSKISIDYGSAEVQIEVVDSPPVPTVTVRSPALIEVETANDEDELLVLRVLNERNARLRFGKFYLDHERERIVVEYEMLGSHLQPEELLHGLSIVATLADDHDDLLKEQIGQGQRAADVSGRTDAVRPF